MNKSLYINTIAIKKCGPLQNITLNFSNNANLIYAKNESGKSYLVEFILSDLLEKFKEKGKIKGRGSKRAINFRLRGEIKGEIIYNDIRLSLLSEFNEEQIRYLLDLITIREAKSFFLNDENLTVEGISRYLSLRSSFKFFDKLKIQSTASKISLDVFLSNETIENKIANIGLGKDYRETYDDFRKCLDLIAKTEAIDITEIRYLQNKKQELEVKKELLFKAKKKKAFILYNKIQQLKSEIEKYPYDKISYLENSLRRKREIEIHLDKINYQINQEPKIKAELDTYTSLEQEQIEAKRFLAYELSLKIKDIKNKLEKYNENIINEIQVNLSNYKQYLNQRIEKKIKIDKIIKELSRIQFIKDGNSIIKEYSKNSEAASKEKMFYVVFSIISIILGIVSLSDTGWLSLLALIAVIFFVYKFFSVDEKYSSTINNYEKFVLKYKNTFGIPFHDEGDIEAKIIELTSLESTLKANNEDLEILEKELSNLKNKIELYFNQIGFKPKETQWEETLETIIQTKNDLNNKITQYIIELKKLDIPEILYSPKEPKVTYNKDKLVEYQHQITKLQSKLAEIDEQKKEKEKLNKELQELYDTINMTFRVLNFESDSKERVEIKFENLKTIKDNLIKQLNAAEGEFQGLGIDPKDFISDDLNIVYDEEKYLEIDKQLKETINTLETKSNNFYQFIGELNNFLNQKLNDFQKLLFLLFEKKEEIRKNIENIEAEIIAQKILYESVEQIKNDKFALAKDVLISKSFNDFFNKITTKTRNIIIDGNIIKINDGKILYPFDSLSLGAKDQFLIGLRIETIRKILNGSYIFLLFDDAFQHSDFHRRKSLVDLFCDLSSEGFQMIYLTMDEHLYNLIKETSYKKNIVLNEITL